MVPLVVRFQPIHLFRRDQGGYHPSHPALILVIMLVENFYLLLRRHHPPSHCCFFRWHHWFGSNTLLLCGASTKQARLPQQARAGEAVGYLSNEPSSFVDFLDLVSNIIIEGSANPVPHSAQRCGSSCCGSVSVVGLDQLHGEEGREAHAAVAVRFCGPGDPASDGEANRWTTRPTGLAAMDESDEGSRSPAQEGQGRASALLQPLPARRLRRAAAVRSQIRWRTADASTDERHRQALLDVGPIGQREGHQDNVKVRQHQSSQL